MSREIKFRAWNKVINKMHDVRGLAMSDESDNLDLLDTSLTGELATHDYNDSDFYVLMQYTGMEDKTGVEIYEGDILRTHKGDFVVTWDKYQFVLPKYFCGSNDVPYDYFSEQGIDEVIGNIYEHPHLLGEGVDNP